MRVASIARSSARRQPSRLSSAWIIPWYGYTSCSGSSSTSRRRKAAAALVEAAQLEAQLGDVERGEDVGGHGTRHLLRRLEGVQRAPDALERGHKPLQGAEVVRIALQRATEIGDRPLAVPRRE